MKASGTPGAGDGKKVLPSDASAVAVTAAGATVGICGTGGAGFCDSPQAASKALPAVSVAMRINWRRLCTSCASHSIFFVDSSFIVVPPFILGKI